MNREQRKLEQQIKTEKLLNRVGYYLLKRKHSRDSFGYPFPDLSVNENAPMSDIAGTPGVLSQRGLPDGAKQFPVGNLHKQGLELITEGNMKNLHLYGGKKI